MATSMTFRGTNIFTVTPRAQVHWNCAIKARVEKLPTFSYSAEDVTK